MLEKSFFLFESIALITLIAQYSKLKHTRYKYFLPYLIFILFYETASLFKVFIIHKSNGWIINFVITIEFLFYSNFITEYFNPRLKKFLRLAVTIILVFSIIDVFLITGFWMLCTSAILLQYTLMIIIICCFFYQLMYNAHQTLSILRLPDFWVNTGMLFFCLSEFLFFASYAYMYYKQNYHYLLLSSVISNLANALLYSCLTIAFLCFSPMKKLSL